MRKLGTLMASVIIIFALLNSASAWDQSWSEASQSGKDSANSILPKVNKGSKITSRFSNPITSNAAPLYTFDDKLGFDAQLTAPSSNAFLDIFIAPSGTGDLTTVNIRQDLNFDGTFDYAYSLTSPVSGVCANGFISANPGTWQDKKFYVWTADSSGKVTATEVASMLDLAGCYCINSSCGSNLVWANVGIVLKDLGGGIVGAIQNQKSVTITSTDVTGTEILYYGQESSSTGNSSGVYFSGNAHPEQYYAGGGGILPSDSEVLNQASDPDSFYYRLVQLNTQTGNQYTTKTCDIKRQIWLDAQSEMIGYRVSFYIGYDADGSSKECFWAKNDGSCRDVWRYGGGWPVCQDTNLSHLGQIVHAIVDTGTCIPYTDPVSGGSGCFSPPGTIDVKSYKFIERRSSSTYPGCYGSGNNSEHQFWKVNAYTVNNPDEYQEYIQPPLILGVRDIPRSSITGSCSALDLTDCQLLEEKVCDYNDANCIYTYRDYNPTGLKPLPNCTQVVSSKTSLTWSFCLDGSSLIAKGPYRTVGLETGSDVWWNIHRTYYCEDNQTYDFTGIQQRAGNIQNTFSEGTSTVTFQDYNPDSGETTGYSIDLPPREDVERCEKSCRVRVAVQDTQASLTGTTATYRDTVDSYREILKPCDGDTCPLEAGETLVEDCRCTTSYFAITTSIMQLMDDASHDIICSTSPPD